MFSGILLSHGAIFSQMIPVRVERKGEEIIKKHQWDKALSVVTKKKYKVSNHLLGNVANLRQRKKKKKKKNSRVVACRGCAAPRRNLFDFHTLRPKQYSSDVRTTQTELISSFSRTCFSQTFSFLLCPIFFSFFFICLLLFIYLSHFVYNLFSSIFFNLQRFKKFSFTRKLSNEVFLANEMKSNFINFPDNIISHTRRYY